MCHICDSSPKFKSKPNTPERMQELAEKQADDILRVGHQVIIVFASDEGPAFAYTVGRSAFEKAELLITGDLHPKQAQMILNTIADLENSGAIRLNDVGHGNPVTLPTFDCELRLLRCDPVAAEMNSALAMTPDLTAYQVVWPDAQGNWPGEDAFEYDEPLYGLSV